MGGKSSIIIIFIESIASMIDSYFRYKIFYKAKGCSSMVVDYKARKNEVLASYQTVEELVKELREYAEKINLPDPTENVETLLSDIRSKAEKVKADRFNIMVAGEAKSGKSTFINAYLGVELLPMDVKQCTSAIVEIKYGDTFSVRATYADGRQKTIADEEEARNFLKENAALDDDYRDIPVPTINSEILVKSGLRAREKGVPISISKVEVEAMLKSPEVQAANIHNLPDYNQRIYEYIKAKKNNWQDIVTKIEVMFPFGEDLLGIENIDSHGVCARCCVAEITSRYIENADAIIFLKPISGQALESTQFNQFMQNASVERNKNALFLVLTRATNVTEKDLSRLEEEAHKQFSNLDAKNILIVDSKAELYVKKLTGENDILGELRSLNAKGTLDSFVVSAWAETNGMFGQGSTQDFIEKLKETSRFGQVYNALNIFGRKAHYILLDSLLDSISKLYGKLWNDMNSRIDMFQQKAEDPTELAKKIADIKQELDIIQNKMSRGVDRVVRRFRGDEGIIKTKADAEVNNFLASAKGIDPASSEAFNQLERLSLKKIDRFKDLQKEIQHQIVAEFDKELVTLSDKSSISFESLKPDFTEETFKKIKQETKSKAYETRNYEEGLTFKKTHKYSVYVQNKHFNAINNNILDRLDEIKNTLTSNLEDFVENIRTKYIDELRKNAQGKKNEMDAIMEAKATAEQIRDIIRELSAKADKIAAARAEANKIEGGISKYVQRNH